MQTLDLYLHDDFVGRVTPDGRNRHRVILDVADSYTQKIVLSESFTTLPGRRAPVDLVSNFLGGYVPEGNHRVQMAKQRQIDEEDLFSLLTEFGGSIAGAITMHKSDESVPYKPKYERLTTKELQNKLKRALDDSDQGLPDDSRSALPGYQPKVLVAKFNADWFYPHGRAHSTHILKPQIPNRPNRLYDEYYSHLLTRSIGLSSFDSEINTVGRMKYLAIERFDRAVAGRSVQLHHQEDLAQALGLDWRNSEVKFQEPAWPNDPKRATIRRMGELLGTIPGGDGAVEQWIRQLSFHVAIGNNDAHAKNVALLHLLDGTQLSEVYDAVPNLFQPGLIKWDMALAIDGVFDHRRMSVERLLNEIASWNVISENRAEQLVADLLNDVSEALDHVTPPDGISPGLPEALQWNSSRLLAGDEISEPKKR